MKQTTTLLFALLSISLFSQKPFRLCPDNEKLSSYIFFPAPNGKTIFMAERVSVGNELFITDGTVSGTKLLKDINQTPFSAGITESSYPGAFFEYNGKVYFSADTNTSTRGAVWVTDGTSNGTNLFKAFTNDGGHSMFYPRKIYNGKLIFTVYSSIGIEPWVTDGTLAGTHVIKDIYNNCNYPSKPDEFTEFNGKLFFSANDGIHYEGLWYTDGTEVGTQLFPFYNDGGSTFNLPTDLKAYNGKLYFMADASPLASNPYTKRRWVTDGTPSGTKLLNIPFLEDKEFNKFMELNGKLYFVGVGLYVTDGTASGSQTVKTINPFPKPNIYYPGKKNTIVYKGKMYFQADDSIHGPELWVSDGTDTGTHLFADINKNHGAGSNPHYFTISHERLFFTANDGVNDYQLYVTDGENDSITMLVPDNWSKTKPLQFLEQTFLGLFDCNGSLFYAADYDSMGVAPYIVTKYPTSISAVKDAISFHLFPNPSNQYIEVRANSPIQTITLVDISGNVVYKSDIPYLTKANINIESFANGLYFVILTNEQGEGRQKLVIQH